MSIPPRDDHVAQVIQIREFREKKQTCRLALQCLLKQMLDDHPTLIPQALAFAGYAEDGRRFYDYDDVISLNEIDALTLQVHRLLSQLYQLRKEAMAQNRTVDTRQP